MLSNYTLDSLSYKESKTPKGNPYHKSRCFNNAFFMSTIILPFAAPALSNLPRDIFEAGLKKCNINVHKNLKWASWIAGTAIFIGIGCKIANGLDKLLTKHRMKKADEKAENENLKNINITN